MLAGLVVIAVAGAVAGWRHHSQRLTAEARADFEWFQGLGFPDVQGRPFERVATGRWAQYSGRPPSNTYENAFLLGTNTNSFKVLTVELSVETFTNTAASTPEHQRIGFAALDLQDTARAEIKRLEQPVTRQVFFSHFGLPLSEQTETFVLAWACWRNGLDREAQGLYEQAKLLPKPISQKPRRTRLRKRFLQMWDAVKEKWQEWKSGKSSATPKPPLRQSAEKELATLTMWQTRLAFQDKSVTRSQLLEKFKATLIHYPRSQYEQQAKDSIKILERMVAEDKAHATVDARTLARMPVEQRVRELVFELRDQDGQPVINNWYSVFSSRDGSTNTPAHQLARIGYPAVPQLIEALGSDDFSRTGGNDRHVFMNPASVMSVGDCAQQILEEISGGLCDFQNPTNGASRRQMAETWWNEHQRKGEKQMVIEAVVAGQRIALSGASRLCEHYPEIAVQTLTNGIQNATEPWVRTQLINSLANLKNPAAEAFLRKEMNNAPEVESRVDAAYGLRNLGKPDALPAMIDIWQRLTETGESQDEEQLIEFLATVNSVEAVSTLKKDLASHPVDVRLDVVNEIGETNKWLWVHGGAADTPSPEIIAAEEEFLVSELDDTEKRMGLSVSRGDVSYSDPRVCDEAAMFLAQRLPARYKFDITKSPRTRERMRIECKNAWLRAHHLPLVPLPVEPKLVKVSRKQATKITVVEFTADSAKPDARYKARVARMKGRLFNGDELVALFTDFVHSPETGCDGLEIEATKDEDLTGVRISIKLLSASSSSSSTWAANAMWEERQRVVVGSEDLGSSSGTGSTENYEDADNWEDSVEAMEKAIDATPETPFSVSMGIRKHY